MAALRFIAIILLCIAGSIVYGIIHDQITARICVEYFTIGHPPVFRTDNPTLLGLGWGVIATWWVGLILGILLAAAARVRSWPKFTAKMLIRPLFVTLLIVGVMAIVAGWVGHAAASRRLVRLFEPMASRIPADRHIAFLTDLWAHLASYICGFFGGLMLCFWVLWQRLRLDEKRLLANSASSMSLDHQQADQ